MQFIYLFILVVIVFLKFEEEMVMKILNFSANHTFLSLYFKLSFFFKIMIIELIFNTLITLDFRLTLLHKLDTLLKWKKTVQ